ncbi:MAG: hypothetical protein K2F62_06770, partial [Muribaculaceae bacterium]|nr:hypothetical protein [Muribaculaceae bacterium]
LTVASTRLLHQMIIIIYLGCIEAFHIILRQAGTFSPDILFNIIHIMFENTKKTGRGLIGLLFPSKYP